MSKLEKYIYITYVLTPYIMWFISLIAWIWGIWNKKMGIDSKKHFKVSKIFFIIGIVVFLILPVAAMIIGFGPGLSD